MRDGKGRILFQYELPLNFKFEPKLTRDLAAIQLPKAQWLGFLFEAEADRVVLPIHLPDEGRPPLACLMSHH